MAMPVSLSRHLNLLIVVKPCKKGQQMPLLLIIRILPNHISRCDTLTIEPRRTLGTNRITRKELEICFLINLPVLRRRFWNVVKERDLQIDRIGKVVRLLRNRERHLKNKMDKEVSLSQLEHQK